MKSTRLESIRRTLYRLQGVLGMTERECKMFILIAGLLLLGSVARFLHSAPTPDNQAVFDRFDKEFQRHIARSDSLDANEIAEARASDIAEESAVGAAKQTPAEAVARPRDGDPSSDQRGTVDGKIDLNLATAEELERLPRIGPALARHILNMRRRLGSFNSIDDLRLVSGIGEKTLDRLRPLAFVARTDSSR